MAMGLSVSLTGVVLLATDALLVVHDVVLAVRRRATSPARRTPTVRRAGDAADARRP